MLRDNAGIDKYLKIYPIKTKIKLNETNGVTKNFEEFQRVYGWILNKRDFTEQSEAEKTHKNVRPLIDLKTIRMEMPALGSEQAIIQPRKKTVIPILKKPMKKVNTEEKVTTTSTEQLVKKLVEFDQPRGDRSLRDMNKNTSSFLEQTNRELDIAAVQLEQIKSIMQFKSAPAEELKRPKTPMHKSKKKNRHSDCIKKKYLSTLSVMQQKLDTLEKKYFNRPKIAYRSVNDTFTQSSEVETIYEKSEYQGVEIDQTLEGIITDLDELMNANVNEKYRQYEPRDLAFNAQRDSDSSNKNEGKQTDSNESRRISIQDSSDDIIVEKQLVNYDSFVKMNNYCSMENESSSTMKKKWSSTYASQNEISGEKSAAKVYTPRNCSPTSSVDFPGYKYDEKLQNTRTVSRKNLSFKKCDSKSQGKDSFSAVIDESEFQLKKYRSMKQDIIDVETFCEKICNLTKDEDPQDMKSNNPTENGGRMFDGSQLQSSVLKSCYLMKEFDNQPKINYFCENDSFSQNKDKYADIYENCSGTTVKSFQKLIRNLNSALDNSIYHAIDTE